MLRSSPKRLRVPPGAAEGIFGGFAAEESAMSAFPPRRLSAAAVPLPRASRRPHLWCRLLARLLAWQERSRQRQQLALLSRHELDDLGLTADQVAAALEKPFWR